MTVKDDLPTTGTTAGGSSRKKKQAGILSRCSAHDTNGYLVITLPADLDTELAEELHLLLDIIGDHRHRGLVINLSSVEILPSKVATVLVQLAHAAKLLDSPAVICGIKPSLAAAISTLDIVLTNVPTARDLDDALVLLARGRAAKQPGQRRAGRNLYNTSRPPE